MSVPKLYPAPDALNSDLLAQIRRLEEEKKEILNKERAITRYLREKIDQLLVVMGTLPLKPEELDDDTLVSLDPVGIIADSFVQVLEHLKETNEELTLARDEVQAIFDSAGAAILVVDGELNLCAYNLSCKEFFFPNEADMVGRNLEEFLCPEKEDECLLDKIVSTKWVAEQSEFLYKGRYFHVIGTPILDRSGEITQIILVYTDITSRRETEESLRDAKTRLHAIFNSVQAGIFLLDPQTHSIVEANDAACKMVGLDSQTIKGTECHQHFCPAARGECPITDLHQTLDNSERLLLRPDGTTLQVLKTAILIDLDGRDHILESFIDITDRKQAESALLESEQKYRSLYNAMKEGVALNRLLYDEAGNPCDYIILDANPALGKILSRQHDELIGAKASDIFGHHPLCLDVFSEVVASRESRAFETAIDSLGKVFHVSAFSPSEGTFAAVFDDITERKRAEDEVQRLAYFDILTNLPNRALLLDRLEQALAQSTRHGEQVGILFLDIDQFKGINDTLGHSVGDDLLKIIAERLSSCIRKSDTVARVGGDEFVIILNYMANEQDASTTAEKILKVLASPIYLNSQEIFSTASIGIAIYPADGGDCDTLLKNADTAMYQAKDNGRNTYQFYTSDMNAQALERMLLQNDLRRALDRGEFSLHYQPQLNAHNGQLIGMEALLRWTHPTLGAIPPSKFIPFAEETGMILPIGRWVLETACRQNKAWQDIGLPPLRVAVNLSGRQFKVGNLAQMVEEILHETQLPAQYLELELTESILMESADDTVHLLRELKKMGVHLAIDDFGTGYSSLNYLKHFPIDRLKIDRSFVRDILKDPDDAAIAEAIIVLAHSLKIKVLAEGVETREQLEFLLARSCDEMQGYYFSHPLCVKDFTTLLNSEMGNKDVCLFQFRSQQTLKQN